MPLLKLGVTGRAVAMGYSSTLEDGPSAIQGNPAGIGSSGAGRTTMLLFTHQEWIQDTRTEFLGVTAPLGESQTIGFSLLTTTVSDIEIRTVPGPAEGTFTSRDMAVGLSCERKLSDAVQAGATARFLYQKLLINDATGFSFDAGARFALPVEGLEAGVAVLNLGRMSVLNQERTKLPAMARGGIGYRQMYNENFAYALRGEIVRIFPEKRFYEGIGGEVWFQSLVALRAGNEFGSEGRGFTAGLGIAYSMFTLDYALAKLSENLGTTHTFTLGLSF
ncbi:MAG TPA: PorV/PorQ family protein [Bacteroidota bacterium]